MVDARRVMTMHENLWFGKRMQPILVWIDRPKTQSHTWGQTQGIVVAGPVAAGTAVCGPCCPHFPAALKWQGTQVSSFIHLESVDADIILSDFVTRANLTAY